MIRVKKTIEFIRYPAAPGLLLLSMLFAGCSFPEGERPVFKSTVLPEDVERLSVMVDSLFRIDKTNEAEPLIHQLTVLAREKDSPVSMLCAAKQRALLASKKYNNNKAIKILDSCLVPAKKIDSRQYIDIYYLLSDIHFNLESPWLSVAYLYDALDQSEKMNDPVLINQSHHHLGLMLFRLKKFREAREHFIKNLDYVRNRNNAIDIMRKQEQYSNVGLTYFEEENYRQALIYYDSALVFINHIISLIDRQAPGTRADVPTRNYMKSAKGVVLGNMGQLYDKTGDFDMADSLGRLSLQINDRDGQDQGHAATVALQLFRMYSRERPHAVSDSLLSQTQRLVKFYGNERMKFRLKRSLVRYLRKTGQEKKALDFVEQLITEESERSGPKRDVMYEDVLTELNFLKQKDKLEEAETALRIKNTQARWGFITSVAVFVSLVVVVIFFRRDRRRRRKLEIIHRELNERKQHIEEKNKELLHLNREKSNILSIVAHDLRKPVTNIQGITRLMHLDIDDKEELAKQIALVEGSVTKALGIIGDLLETARMEEGKSFVAEPVCINEVLEEAVLYIEKEAAGKGIVIERPFFEEPLFVSGNKNKLSRVVDNLLSNALKFTEEGGFISINLSRKDERVEIEVKDNGIGMSREQLQVVFQRFTSAGRQGTRGEETTGIGMSIVKKIIELHHGTVRIESEEGKGTRVLIVLPLIPAKQEPDR